MVWWLLITIILVGLLSYGRNNTPVFSGDHPDVINKR